MKSSHLHTTSRECHPRQESPCLKLQTLPLPATSPSGWGVITVPSAQFWRAKDHAIPPPSCRELPSGTSTDFFSWSVWVQVACATSVHVLWHEGWSRVNLGESVPRTCPWGGHVGWGGGQEAGLWCWWFSTAFQVILRFCQGNKLAGKKMFLLLNWLLTWFTTLKSKQRVCRASFLDISKA